jgi:hypothetical protein
VIVEGLLSRRVFDDLIVELEAARPGGPVGVAPVAAVRLGGA